MKILFKLFLTFFKIGAFTIGGGYAMIPLFELEFVERKKWLTDEDFMNMMTIVSSAPGPIAVNSAVYTGYHVAGFLGAIFSVLGVIIPPIFIILCIAVFYNEIREITVIDRMFYGARPAVVGLMITAVYKLGKRAKLKGIKYIIPIISFILISILNFEPIIIIVTTGILGYIFSRYCKRA